MRKDIKIFKTKSEKIICWYCEKEIKEFALEYHYKSPWTGSANLICKKCAKGSGYLK